MIYLALGLIIGVFAFTLGFIAGRTSDDFEP